MGFCSVLSIVPSLSKSHAQAFIILPDDVSVNSTVSGVLPFVGVAVKFATGGI
ncbi:hypothetical protein DSECCO2_487020 [anaerobic digester metagenome]